MTFKRLISTGLTVIYLLGIAALASAAPTGPLAQVIEGAKKEGTCSFKLTMGFTQKSMDRLEKEIKARYGVDLKLNFTATESFPKDLAEAIMEQKTGGVPSYDFITLSSHLQRANKAGAVEQVDWKPLLSPGTNPEVVHENPMMRGGIIYHTNHGGIMYNPDKVKADEVPKTLSALASPKWKGRVGVITYETSWARWCFVLGNEKVLSALRAIMKNEAIQGNNIDLWNRYLLGESWFCYMNSSHMVDTREKGMPAAYQCLEFADVQLDAAAVLKGARHPNAAKLVALYLASPQGAKFELEEAKAGTLYYPGNFEHEIRLQNQKQGLREIFAEKSPEILEFYNSKEGVELQKEIRLILQTGGGR